jgi:hypothetical protein
MASGSTTRSHCPIAHRVAAVGPNSRLLGALWALTSLSFFLPNFSVSCQFDCRLRVRKAHKNKDRGVRKRVVAQDDVAKWY